MAIHFQRVSGAKLEVAHDQGSNTLHQPMGGRPVMTPALSSPPLRAMPLAPAASVAKAESQPTDSVTSRCPTCDNEQTHRVPVIFSALTSQTHSRKSGDALILAVERLWNNGPTHGDASARYAQRSQFAKRFAPPPMDCARLVEAGRSRVAVAGSAALVACLVVMIPLVLLDKKSPAVPSGSDFQQPDTSHLAWPLKIVMAIALFGLPIFVFAKVSAAFDAEIARLRQEEWKAFDKRKQAWKDSFFCHHCDTVFNPVTRQEE
jgi:hypothetical protein